MLIRFHTIPACHGRTDGRTDIITISISRVSSRMLTRDKNKHKTVEQSRVSEGSPVGGEDLWLEGIV